MSEAWTMEAACIVACFCTVIGAMISEDCTSFLVLCPLGSGWVCKPLCWPLNYLWTHQCTHRSVLPVRSLGSPLVVCFSTREGRYCSMDIDFQSHQIPRCLSQVSEGVECVLGQSVLKLLGQPLAFMKTAAPLQPLIFFFFMRPQQVSWDDLACILTCLPVSGSWCLSYNRDDGELWFSLLWWVLIVWHQRSDTRPGTGACNLRTCQFIFPVVDHALEHI